MDSNLTIPELRILLAMCQAADPVHLFLPQVAQKLQAQLQALEAAIPFKGVVIEEKKA